MVDSPSTKKAINTGQNDKGNNISTQNNVGQQQQRSNLVENFQRNSNNGKDDSQHEVDENVDEDMSSNQS